MTGIENIDFGKLKPYDGKVTKCFEQLCYQIALKEFGHLGKFTPIDGSGGDGGNGVGILSGKGEKESRRALLVSAHADTVFSSNIDHTIHDLVRATRTQFTVRSRTSKFKGKTVGSVRNKLAKEVNLTCTKEGVAVYGFIVRVKGSKSFDGHVIFVDINGDTLVDTAKRKRDVRIISHVYIVYRPIRRGVECIK